MLWWPFNALLNSSTRCELAAAILAVMPGIPMHVAIENVAVVGVGNKIIRRYEERQTIKPHEEEGQMMLGGRKGVELVVGV